MLWIKTLHIVFVTSWFAGLFYLPRIFVNLAEEDNAIVTERLLLMARRLYRFMSLLSIPAIGFGVWLLMGYHLGRGNDGAKLAGWMQAKLAIVVLLFVYHRACGTILKQFEKNLNTRSEKWFRWFNEIPVLLLLAAVAMVVVRPL
jgi:putative membrane protein